MIYAVSITVFAVVIMPIVLILLFVESKIVEKGLCRVIINDSDEKSIEVQSGKTLLMSLADREIYIPSACGGSGSCGQCKCVVEEGGGDILPTELPHLSRKNLKEKKRLACQLKVKTDMNIRVPDEIFSVRKYNAEVVSNKNVATFIKELVVRVDPEDELDFEAGAYLQMDIPEYELCFTEFDIAERFVDSWNRFSFLKICTSSDEPVFRAYSLANPPYEKECLKFTIRIATPPKDHKDLPPGIGSSYIFGLKPGDQIVLSGPFGEFFIKETEREMCFVGGGAGMAPMRSLILHQLNAVHTKRPMTFWYGARSEKELFYDEEFKELDKKFDNFSYHVAFSEPEPGDDCNCMTGFIHQCLYDSYLKSHKDPTEIEYYLCGPGVMIDAVNETLYNLGVEEDMIAYDMF